MRRVSAEGGGAGTGARARGARGTGDATGRSSGSAHGGYAIDAWTGRDRRGSAARTSSARAFEGSSRGRDGGRQMRWVSGARTSAAFDGWILSNSTTRPPLSPVARCSPVLSNSTALIMSAAFAIGDWDEASGQRPRVGYRGLRGKSDIVDACRGGGGGCSRARAHRLAPPLPACARRTPG